MNHLSSSFSHPCLRAGRGQRGTPFVPADHLCSGLLPQAHGGAQRPETRECPPGRQHERQDRRLRYTERVAKQQAVLSPSMAVGLLGRLFGHLEKRKKKKSSTWPEIFLPF